MRTHLDSGKATLYLHGLESSIEGKEKQAFLYDRLHKTGLIAEDLNYVESKVLDDYLTAIESGEIQNFIGSSYGAALAFVCANICQRLHPKRKVNLLAFNPPICNIPEILPHYPLVAKAFDYTHWHREVSYTFCLSLFDEVVDPQLTFAEIIERMDIEFPLTVNTMKIKHRIPYLNFTRQIDRWISAALSDSL
jgi:hypothetical protein